MKIPNLCNDCTGCFICSAAVSHGSESCVDFHNALESKLQSATPNNKQSKSLLCPNCGNYDLYKSVSSNAHWCNTCQFQWDP